MEYIKSLLLSDETSFNCKEKTKITFFIHDKEHSVDPTAINPATSLNKYLRDSAYLRGTKNMCLEGGCGTCIVAVSFQDPVTQQNRIISVNSCLVPIFICSGWNIYTVDKLGNPAQGYHPVQKALYQFNGTQCGFCSSGMIMNMYALYESSKFTMRDIEDAFGGNICRCTGYRPILAGFRSLASDASEDLLMASCDIEDVPVCKRDSKLCEKKCHTGVDLHETHLYISSSAKWYKVYYINEILDIIRSFYGLRYMLVGGNTASGVYRENNNYDLYIDTNSVVNLRSHRMESDKLVLGANMTLTNVILLLNTFANYPHFWYFKKLAEHISLVAHVPVRNIGTLAGNLFTKYLHREFPSDIFLVLEAVGATITTIGIDRTEVTLYLKDFLDCDMTNRIIKEIRLPSLNHSYRFESYKVTPRAQNAHAMVNAAFLIKLNDQSQVKEARIVYGGINPDFTHAKQAERYLLNKPLFNNNTLKNVFKILDQEIHPDYVLPDPTPEFRKEVSIALFYKFVLSIAPNNLLSSKNKSGGAKLKRPLSSGIQDFDTNKSVYPVSQPVLKLEALAQCTGKAEYIMDIPDSPYQLYAAFVLAKAPAHSIIIGIDASNALKLDGVVAFYDKSDIPGENNFTPTGAGLFYNTPEELFCSGEVKHYFQPVGIVVATSLELAEEASELVQIVYSPGDQQLLLTVRDLVESNPAGKINQEQSMTATTRGNDIKRVFKGEFNVTFQYHYHMENQCCVVIPVEDGLDMYPASQDMVLSQYSAARVLNIEANKINVKVRRLGGAYGAKISRNSQVSSATALAAYKLQKPVKMSMSLTANMNVMGKRNPFYATYEVGVNDRGVIQYLNASLYSDLGCSGGNEKPTLLIFDPFVDTYRNSTWNVTTYTVLTDNHTNTWCRAPGTAESISCLESIMQHICTSMNLDPIEMRILNLASNRAPLEKHLRDLVEWAQVTKRKALIKKFNQENRWIKRGLAVTPMFFPTINGFGNWNALVSIYQTDGTVSISHGGIEMGQGINTKAAQVCAYALGIPLNSVSVKSSNSTISPNPVFTGGSTTSEGVCYAVNRACDILKQRMKPVRDSMNNPTWRQLVKECYRQNIELTATSMYHFGLPDVQRYPIYGATCTEVELDVLTGQSIVKRVDLLEDVGNSLSPLIDVGQVEGAFVMGIGYWTSEETIFDDEGQLFTNRTWNYKPPGFKDIPVEFKVRFPKNNPNPLGVLNSKATGEPPFCMSFSVALAIKDAVGAARNDAIPNVERWYPVDGPSTVENSFLNSLNNYNQYVM